MDDEHPGLSDDYRYAVPSLDDDGPGKVIRINVANGSFERPSAEGPGTRLVRVVEDPVVVEVPAEADDAGVVCGRCERHEASLLARLGAPPRRPPAPRAPPPPANPV